MRRIKVVVTVCLVTLTLVSLYVWLDWTDTQHQNTQKRRQQIQYFTFQSQPKTLRKSIPPDKTHVYRNYEKNTSPVSKGKFNHKLTHPKFSESDKLISKEFNTKVYSRNSGKWTEDTHICKTLPSFHNATLKLRTGNIPIFIHDPQVDRAISRTIAETGAWEREMVNVILDLLIKNPKAQFMDLGSNLGVYSLAAASLGRKVIAVDPLNINIQRMCKSFASSGHVTLVFNALSDEIQNVTLGKDRDNVGGTYVMQNKNMNKVRDTQIIGQYSDVVMTAHLDHIMELPGFEFRDSVIKMDVEGYELKVLRSGINFFKRVNVLALMMEWNYHRTGPIGQEIIKFLIERNFSPYSPSTPPQKLRVHLSHNWPWDVVWMKDMS